MKKHFVYLLFLALAVATLASCSKFNKPEEKSDKVYDPFDNEEAVAGYYGYAQMSVPAATTTVYVEYKNDKGHTTVIPVSVEPKVTTPVGGKDVEPFGTVNLLLSSPEATRVNVYYLTAALGQQLSTKAEANQTEIYTLTDFPVDQIESGEFGKTRYVRVKWAFAYQNTEESGLQGTPTYPKDVVFYDKEHNHTLRYKFAYSGSANGAAYFLDEAYEIENYVVKGEKLSCPCGECENSPYVMPWGCMCGCGGEENGEIKLYPNPNFTPNGDLTGQYVSNSIVINPSVQSTVATGNGGSVTVDEYGTIIVDYAPYNVADVTLPEPARYVSSSQDQTFYHSSGVVMFEDSWPTCTKGGVYDTDFDDVVIDYDFEAKVMPDSMLATDDTREQVKVVLHLRAVGSGTPNRPSRVGVMLENFDQQYVESVEEHFTLDSYNNPHGTLPAFTETTIQRNSAVYTSDSKNPVVEMAHIFTLNQERAGSGDDAVYTYRNGDFSNTTVFNLTYGYKQQDKSQYDPELETMELPSPGFKNIIKQKFYNCIPGYMNVAGGLITYTVIFNMKSRAGLGSEEREMAKQNMIDAVINTTAQNFYIINGDFTPIGLKGYSPVLIHNESVSKFNSKLSEAISAGDILSSDNPYAGTNGMVWGIKCPTLTRHVWNKLHFSDAYPLYEGWITSMGATNAGWYFTDVDERYLVCEW